MRSWWSSARDAVLFIAGLAGVVHETLLATQTRPELLILFAAMMGLPAFLQADSRTSRSPKKDDEETGGPS